MPILNPGSEPTPGCPGQGPALTVQGDAVRPVPGQSTARRGVLSHSLAVCPGAANSQPHLPQLYVGGRTAPTRTSRKVTS